MINELLAKMKEKNIISFKENDNFANNNWTSTGSPELDFNLNTYGFPKGIIEISGKSKSGKTTLALHLIKNFQKKHKNDGGLVVILSSENRDNKSYAQQIGVDVDNVLIYKIRYVEEMLLSISNLIKNYVEICKEQSKTPKILFVWDSIGSTLSKDEIEAMEENANKIENAKNDFDLKDSYKNAKVGAFAKNTKAMMKYVLNSVYDFDITFICLNHTYNNIGSHGQTSFGGEWTEYIPTLRLNMRYKDAEKIDEVEVAQRSVIKVIKNDFSGKKDTVIEILLGYGLVLSESDIEYAIDRGILTKVSAKKIEFKNGEGENAKVLAEWSSKRTFYELYKKSPSIMDLLTVQISKSRHNDVFNLREGKNKK